jgi:hypothetical protein
VYTIKALLRTIREGLLDIGYREDLLQEHYEFADLFADTQPLRSVELGAFALEPPSYRNACLGVVVPPHRGPEAIRNYRSLGAPQIFALHTDSEEIFCWKILAHDTPVLIEKIEAVHFRNAIHAHRAEWNPETILRAKSIRFTREPVQLDFFDRGLIPLLESIVYEKLDRLLNDVIASCQSVYQEHHHEELDYRALFRLIFRLIAAKLLGDRQYPGKWLDTNAQEVIKAVEHFYFQHYAPESVLDDVLVQDTAWRQIRTAFSFRNLSVEALAYVYENTLVTSETRKVLGTHATPPAIAEYIVQNLPLEELPSEERHIFEPFCGHAPFLTAALARLRTLLPPDMRTEQRHEYFRRMLSGTDIDSFACEIARNSLILADYPNPDGWDITNNDFFASSDPHPFLTQAQVVLCNPPYEDFTMSQRQANPALHSANKAVEALHRILQHPPKMLGVVLPRVFINGQSYRQVKKQINECYKDITLVELPPIFTFSEAETVLLIAHGNQTSQPTWQSVIVEKKDYQQFISTGQPTLQTAIPFNPVKNGEESDLLWQSRLKHIWDELASLPHLGDIADIHRGIEYNLSLKENENELVSDIPQGGFARGLRKVTDDFEPYTVSTATYLNMNPVLMRRDAYKLPWDKPKVIANAARLSRGHWLIAGAVDDKGLVCTHRFHGIWPTGALPIEVIAAVLNGPIANAFLSVARTSRDNQIRTLRQIPIPNFSPSQIHLIVSLVRDYIAYRERWQEDSTNAKYYEGSCRGLMGRIDAEILGMYNLSLDLEREIIDYFKGYTRPGPVSQAQLKHSPTKRLYSTLISVEGVRSRDDDKVVDVVVISWNPYRTIELPISLFPRDLQEKLDRDVRLFAKVNIGAKEVEDLIFEDIELAPEPTIHVRFA